jgi:hypothetical protein
MGKIFKKDFLKIGDWLSGMGFLSSCLSSWDCDDERIGKSFSEDLYVRLLAGDHFANLDSSLNT